MINGRVILLLVAAALFAHIWSAQGNSHLARNEEQGTRAGSTSTIPTAAHISDADSTTVESIAGTIQEPVPSRAPLNANRRAGVQKVSLKTPPDEPVFSVTGLPLPAGIVPGKYYVTNNEARVQLVEVTPEQTISSRIPGEAGPDFYLKSLGQQRWLFIPYPSDVAQVVRGDGISPHDFLAAAGRSTHVPEIAKADDAPSSDVAKIDSLQEMFPARSYLWQWRILYDSLRSDFARVMKNLWRAIATPALSGFPNSWSHAIDGGLTPPEFSTAADDDQDSSAVR